MGEQRNKVKYGLANVHIWKILTDTPEGATYDEVIKIPGAVDLSISAEGDEGVFYADNMKYFSMFANGGYSGDLEIALIPDEFNIKILGQKVDKNGAIYESESDRPANFAMAFEFDGDKHATRHILYNVAASRPDITGHTTKESKEPQTDKIKISCSPLQQGVIKLRLAEGKTGYNEFFTKPYLPQPAAGATE